MYLLSISINIYILIIMHINLAFIKNKLNALILNISVKIITL